MTSTDYVHPTLDGETARSIRYANSIGLVVLGKRKKAKVTTRNTHTLPSHDSSNITTKGGRLVVCRRRQAKSTTPGRITYNLNKQRKDNKGRRVSGEQEEGGKRKNDVDGLRTLYTRKDQTTERPTEAG